MNYIHLRHYHTEVQGFDHPLLDGCHTVSAETLNDMATRVLAGEHPDTLILSLRGCVSMLVGRFLANWPDSAPYLEEMVSEGMTEIVRLCHNIPLDLFAERGILVIATSRAQSGIERMLNKLRALAAPARNLQFKLISKNEDPIYLIAQKHVEEEDDNEDYQESSQPYELGDEGFRDILDAFCKLVPKDELDEILMDEYNWGKTNKELSDEFDTPTETIRRRRQQLYEQYLELTE